MLQFCSKQAVILGLRLPDTFKFIEIILTIEHLILQTCIRIIAQLLHLKLSHSLMIEVQLLATVAYCAKVSACSCNLTIYLLKHNSYLLKCHMFADCFCTPTIILYTLISSTSVAFDAFQA